MAMAKVYARRIWDGAYEFEDVPAKYSDKVLAVMRQNVADGEHTTEEFEERTGQPYEVDEE
jgi:hypothetical protein